MKCKRCGIKNANIMIKYSVNGKENELALCESCVKSLGFSGQDKADFSLNPASSFLHGNILDALNKISNPFNVTSAVTDSERAGEIKCDKCGMTLSRFKEKGKLGCASCHETFAKQLEQVLRRVQSGDSHRGRGLGMAPESDEIKAFREEISQIRDEITKAVGLEDYEKAANLKAQSERILQKIETLKSENGGDNP